MRTGLFFGLAVCGVVAGLSYEATDLEKEVPLHEREWVKDGAEELERKWGFEVSQIPYTL